MANKSYKPYSLTTLQLPAPSSNLTKAEYKDAYGIDLDSVDIPSFKLVVYGNDKYAIDQVKAIEDGYEIYFNGRILSITDIVQTSDKVYDVANSKPIYIHPITIVAAGSRISALLFDNSPTALTANTFIDWLDNLYELVGAPTRLMVSGAFLSDASKLTIASIMGKTAADTYYIMGVDVDGTNNANRTFASKTSFANWISEFYDGINKIN